MDGNSLLANYSCQCKEFAEADKAAHIISNHLTQILDDIIKPAFARHEHPSLSKRWRGNYANPVTDSTHLEDQAWKNSEGYQVVSILEWIIEAASADRLKAILPRLIPPLLLILDDFEPRYKTRGVSMFHSLTTKLNSKDMLGAGIDNVFMDALFKCLTYVSDEDYLPLLTATYPCLMDLVAKTREPNSQSRAELFEKIMTQGILLGMTYASHRVEFLVVFLQNTKRIYIELGPLGVRYLEFIIPALCRGISHVPSSASNRELNYRLNVYSMESLQTVMEQTWPRIPKYRGPILKALATSWLFYYRDGGIEGTDKSVPCALLKTNCKLLREATNGIEKADVDALLEYDKNIFAPLVN